MRRTTSKQLGGIFWLLPVGIVLAVISLFEGSFVWSAFCIVTGWIGFAAGFGGSVGLANLIEEKSKTDGDANLGRPRLRDIILFWGPMFAVIWFAQLMLDKLPDEFKPRSYESFGILTFFESSAIYFCWTGAAFYETWRRTRTLPEESADDTPQNAA